MHVTAVNSIYIATLDTIIVTYLAKYAYYKKMQTLFFCLADD